MRMQERGPPGPVLSPAPSHLALDPVYLLSETIRMAPGTRGEGRPAVVERPHAARGQRAYGMLGSTALSKRHQPSTALPCSPPRGNPTAEAGTGVRTDFPCGPARGMAFVRCAHVPVASREDFFFSTSRRASFEAGRSKNCLGLWGLSHPGQMDFLFWRCLYGTRNRPDDGKSGSVCYR